MVTETTGINPYNVIDTGLKIFIDLLALMFLVWCIFQIVKYCKIIKENFTESKVQETEFDELSDIKNSVNATLAKYESERDAS